MTYKGRYKIYALITLSGLFLLQLILFSLFADDIATGVLLLMLLILAISILATVAVWLGVKKTESKINALPPSYKTSFIDANEIIGLSALSMQNKKLVSNMILEIFEEAHLNNRPLEDVVTPNLESFIDGFISSMGGQTSFIYLFGYSTFVYTLYLFFMKAYLVLRHGPTTLDSFGLYTLDLGIVILYAIIAFVFMPWMLIVMQSTAKKQVQGIKSFKVAIPFLLPVALVAALILIDADWFIEFIDRPLPILSTPLGIGLTILVSVASFVLMKVAKRKQYLKAID